MRRVLLAGMLLLFAACAALPSQVHEGFRASLVALSVGNLDESVRWYQTNLGMTVTDRKSFPEYKVAIVMMRREGFELELVRHDESVPPPADIVRDNPARLRGINKVRFTVDDLRRWEASLRANGVRFQLEPRDNGDGTRACIVLDPDGNWIELIGKR